MNCKKCGFIITNEDQVCPNCGEDLTSLSDNVIVSQEIPDKIEPVKETDTIIKPDVITEMPTISLDENTNTFEPIKNVNTDVPINITPKKKKNTKLIIGIIVGLIIIGIGIFFGLKIFNKNKPLVLEEEDPVYDDVFYPINNIDLLDIVKEFDYYRVEAKKLDFNNLTDFKTKLKVPTDNINYSGDDIDVQYTPCTESNELKDYDYIENIYITTYKESKEVETSMNLVIYDEKRLKDLMKTFVDYYKIVPFSKSEKYDGRGAYTSGYWIDIPNDKDLIITYIEVDNDIKPYYTINITETD